MKGLADLTRKAGKQETLYPHFLVSFFLIRNLCANYGLPDNSDDRK